VGLPVETNLILLNEKKTQRHTAARFFGPEMQSLSFPVLVTGVESVEAVPHACMLEGRPIHPPGPMAPLVCYATSFSPVVALGHPEVPRVYRDVSTDFSLCRRSLLASHPHGRLRTQIKQTESTASKPGKSKGGGDEMKMPTRGRGRGRSDEHTQAGQVGSARVYRSGVHACTGGRRAPAGRDKNKSRLFFETLD